MTSKAEDFDAVDLAEAPSVADLKARGAADRMWQKVEEDLDRLDQAANYEADNG